MLKKIVGELKKHIKFTLLGAFLGIVFLMMFRDLEHKTAERLFYFFHPMHVFFSAVATTGMYVLNKKGHLNFLVVLFVGVVGSIGIATLSDSIMPYVAERILRLPETHMHIGIVHAFPVVLGVTLAGIALACFKPNVKFSHFLHVFISTWASAFHILTAMNDSVAMAGYLLLFVFLFFSVWVPCCLSDIIFPLLFVGKKGQP